jgi:hypothetical protein
VAPFSTDLGDSYPISNKSLLTTNVRTSRTERKKMSKSSKDLLQIALDNLPASFWGANETCKKVDLLYLQVSSCEELTGKAEWQIKFRRFNANHDGQTTEAGWYVASCRSSVKLDVGVEYIAYAVIQSDATPSVFNDRPTMKDREKTKVKEIIGVFKKLGGIATTPKS